MLRVPTLALSLLLLLALPGCLADGAAPVFNSGISLPGNADEQFIETGGEEEEAIDVGSRVQGVVPLNTTQSASRSLIANLNSSYILGREENAINLTDNARVSSEGDPAIVAETKVAKRVRRFLNDRKVPPDSVFEAPEVPDPLADAVKGITPAGLPLRQPNRVVIENQSVTLTPGYYAEGILIKGSSLVVLEPGIYFIENGGFHVLDDSAVSGDGVLIVNNSQVPFQTKKKDSAGRESLETNYANSLRIMQKTRVRLTGIHDEKLEGLVYYQPGSRPLEFRQVSNATLNGVVYAPTSRILISGWSRVMLNGFAVVGALRVGREIEDTVPRLTFGRPPEIAP